MAQLSSFELEYFTIMGLFYWKSSLMIVLIVVECFLRIIDLFGLECWSLSWFGWETERYFYVFSPWLENDCIMFQFDFTLVLLLVHPLCEFFGMDWIQDYAKSCMLICIFLMMTKCFLSFIWITRKCYFSPEKKMPFT